MIETEYITDGKFNHTVKTFWTITYGALGSEKEINTDDVGLCRVLLAMQTESPVELDGIYLRKNYINSVEPNFKKFMDWNDDNIPTDENGHHHPLLRDGARTEAGFKKISEPIHMHIKNRISDWVIYAIENNKVKHFLAKATEKHINELKKPAKQISGGVGVRTYEI